MVIKKKIRKNFRNFIKYQYGVSTVKGMQDFKKGGFFYYLLKSVPSDREEKEMEENTPFEVLYYGQRYKEVLKRNLFKNLFSYKVPVKEDFGFGVFLKDKNRSIRNDFYFFKLQYLNFRWYYKFNNYKMMTNELREPITYDKIFINIRRREKWVKDNTLYLYRFLFYNSFVYYKSWKKRLFKMKVRSKRVLEFLSPKRKFYKNRVLQYYFRFLYLFNNLDLSNYYGKNLVYNIFMKRLFFFYRLKHFFNYLRLKKSHKRSFLFLFNKLQSHLLYFLSNLGYRNSKNLLRRNKIYINGLNVNYKNYILKNSDLIYFDLDSVFKPFKYDYLYFFDICFSYEKVEMEDSSVFTKFKAYHFDNLIFLKSFYCNNSLLQINFFEEVDYQTNFYLKIFEKKSYFSSIKSKKFHLLQLRKNKYFKLKYLFKLRLIKGPAKKKLLKGVKSFKKLKFDPSARLVYFKRASKNNRKLNKYRLNQYNRHIYKNIEILYRYLFNKVN